MKKTILITLAAMAFGAAASGQEIALGERVPEFRIAAWLDDRQPEPAPLTYIEFFSTRRRRRASSRSSGCANSPGARANGCASSSSPANSTKKVARMLRPYLSEHIGVALDAARGFELFGVRYVPFGVLTDRRNRALWMGNTLQFDEETIQQSTR